MVEKLTSLAMTRVDRLHLGVIYAERMSQRLHDKQTREKKSSGIGWLNMLHKVKIEGVTSRMPITLSCTEYLRF